MFENFEVSRTHRYETGEEVPVEFNVKGKSFDDVKKSILAELGLDNPEEAIFTGIQIERNDSRTLRLQTGETCSLTDGARINVIVEREWDGTIRCNITPNHHIWDTSKMGVEVISRDIRSSMQ